MNKINTRGFTLIELAIVLVIIAILVGSFVGTLTTRIENTRVTETEDELEEIKQALIGYAFTNGYLPCADCIGAGCPTAGNTARDGAADRTGNQCDVGNETGSVPWGTLGMAGRDAWSTRYRYWVDPTYTDSGTLFSLADASTGVINNRDNADAIQTLTINVVAVVFSHGKNSYGGISSDNVDQSAIPVGNVDENENSDDDVIFVSRPPTTEEATTAGGEFDDTLIWISEFELKAKMVEAGVLP